MQRREQQFVADVRSLGERMLSRYASPEELARRHETYQHTMRLFRAAIPRPIIEHGDQARSQLPGLGGWFWRETREHQYNTMQNEMMELSQFRLINPGQGNVIPLHTAKDMVQQFQEQVEAINAGTDCLYRFPPDCM